MNALEKEKRKKEFERQYNELFAEYMEFVKPFRDEKNNIHFPTAADKAKAKKMNKELYTLSGRQIYPEKSLLGIKIHEKIKPVNLFLGEKMLGLFMYKSLVREYKEMMKNAGKDN